MRIWILGVAILLLNGCVTSETVSQRTPLAPDPNSQAQARIALGIGYLEQNRLAKARENFEIAHLHAPDYYPAQLALAHYFDTVNESSSAKQLYLQAMKTHPNNGHVLNNYATFLCKHRDYVQADKLFNQAVKQPDYYSISASYENAAFCSIKAKNDAAAIRYFRQALDYEPNRISALLNLVKLEISHDQLTQARLRLITFHHTFGVTKPSLELLIALENKAGNTGLEQQYRYELSKLTPVTIAEKNP